jgi:CD2 antigen cytoplasmic tail-binding protein 2
VFQADAEVDYEEPEQLVNDAGIPFEPFNLKEERDAGYFDAATGSYIQLKKKEDVEDAWADALAATEVDPGWAQAVVDRASAREVKARGRQSGTRSGGGSSGGGPRESSSSPSDLSAEDIIELKRKIVSLLQPGETVLAALRRLGRARISGETGAVTGAVGEPVAETIAKEKQGSQVEGAIIKDGQEYHNHHQQKQQQEKEHHTSLIKRASLTPQAQVEFDQLTDWSSLLMEAGEFLIHSQTREELLRNIELGRGTGGTREEEGEGTKRRTDAAAVSIAPTGDIEKEDINMFLSEDIPLDIEQSLEEKEKEPALEPAPQSTPAAADESNGLSPHLQGFILDQGSGYYYNSILGAYYDPSSSLFGDAASGRWYRLDQNTGQYILV